MNKRKNKNIEQYLSIKDIQQKLYNVDKNSIVHVHFIDNHSAPLVMENICVVSHKQNSSLFPTQNNDDKIIVKDALLLTTWNISVDGEWNKEHSTCKIESETNIALTLDDFLCKTTTSSVDNNLPLVIRIPNKDAMNDYNSGKNRKIYQHANNALYGAFYDCYYITDVISTNDGVELILSEDSKKISLSKKEQKHLWNTQTIQTTLFIILGLFIHFVSTIINPNIDTLMDKNILFQSNFIAFMSILIASLSIMCGNAALLSYYQRKRQQNYYANKTEQKQGIYGEFIIMPSFQSFVYMILTGISEEMLFRYGLLTIILSFVLSFGANMTIGIFSAIILSSVLFSIAHIGSYKNISEFIVLSLMGVLLGIVFIVTNNIIIPITIHALYDFIVIAISKRNMNKNQHIFFGGLKPIQKITNMEDNNSVFIVV